MVVFQGGGGSDSATLSGGAGVDTLTLSPTGGTLVGAGYSIAFTALEDVTLNGKAGGKNTIHLAQIAYKLHQNGVWVKA